MSAPERGKSIYRLYDIEGEKMDDSMWIYFMAWSFLVVWRLNKIREAIDKLNKKSEEG